MATKSNSMFKISQLAKDLGSKPKDITNMLTELGITVKSNSATLEPDEFNLLFTKLSESAKIKDIEGYMNGRTKIVMPLSPAEKEAAQKAAEEALAKAEAEAKAKAEAEAKKAEEKKPAAKKTATKKAEEKAEKKPVAEKKPAAKKATKKADKQMKLDI